MARALLNSGSRWFRSSEPTKSEKVEELENILRTGSSFPGIPLHVCAEDISLADIEKVRVTFPVHIRNTSLIKEAMRRGSFPQPLTPEVKNYVLTVRAGRSETQGQREYMEDRTTLLENICDFSVSGEESPLTPVSYFAIFDGHAGYRAAEICQNHLHGIIQEHEQFRAEGDLSVVLADSLRCQDEKIISQGQTEGWKEGTCVSIVLIRSNELFAANLGDSHMILAAQEGQGLRPIRISATHKATEADEKKRILSAGGMVMRGRVFGDLSISRALGDLDYKKPAQEDNYVSNEAFTTTVELSSIHPFAIIASDGLWDKISFQEGIEFVQTLCNDSALSAQEISQRLIDEAVQRDSGDNISVIVILFDWEEDTRAEDTEEPETLPSETDASKEERSEQLENSNSISSAWRKGVVPDSESEEEQESQEAIQNETSS